MAVRDPAVRAPTDGRVGLSAHGATPLRALAVREALKALLAFDGLIGILMAPLRILVSLRGI